MRKVPGERRRWCPRHGRHGGAAARAPAAATDASQSAGGTVQLAIGLLTASLDSPEPRGPWWQKTRRPSVTSSQACTSSPSCCFTSWARLPDSRQRPYSNASRFSLRHGQADHRPGSRAEHCGPVPPVR
jgi:hypothetical protein